MIINLNQNVRVRLNARGRKIYRDYWREAAKASGQRIRAPQVLTLQMHEFCAIFGPALSRPTFGLPFESAEIEVLSF